MSTKPKALEHYWLVSGSVLFTRKDSDDVESINLNTTITNPVEQVTAKNIGKSQQALQMLLFQRLGIEINVHDVFIISINYLGRMNSDTFIAGVNELQND